MYCKLALKNVKKCFKDYAVYFLTLMFGVCVFYAFNSLAQQGSVLGLNETQSKMLFLLATLINFVSVFIAVILGFLVVYANRFLIRRRKREFGIYLTLGMDRSKVSLVIMLETLFVGLLSLGVGLLFGVAVSQAMFYITAALFETTIDTFIISFSPAACSMTIVCFAVIFFVALIFNVVTVSRYKLINLLNAERTSERVKLRNLPLSVILFIVSLVFIGVAYALLLENGLLMVDEKFAASTACMLIGTFLFFFSLSGFLLRAVQLSKKVYFRGLNMFILRQLNSRINTAFLSIALVCVALFFAITSTCGGFAICTTLNDNLAQLTPYDASLSAYYANDCDENGVMYVNSDDEVNVRAAADNYDMHAALVREVPEYTTLVRDDVQIDHYFTQVTVADLLERVDYDFGSAVGEDSVAIYNPLLAVKLSQFNALRLFAGKEAIDLAANEYLIWCNFDLTKGFFQKCVEQNVPLDINGYSLLPFSTVVDNVILENSGFAANAGVIVVNDEVVPEGQTPWSSILNVAYQGSRDEIETPFVAALEAAYGKDSLSVSSGWPYLRVMTAVFVCDQSVGLSTVVAYLAIYIGFVLLIACAAILALQQLSEAADNRVRYATLGKIGADRSMINRALLVQIGVYFLFPLILAIAHSAVALSVVTDVVKLFGMLDIAGPLSITVAFALVIYGGYFLITYFGARSIIMTKVQRTE